MAQVASNPVVPALLKLAETEKDKKRRQLVESIAQRVDELVHETEEMREATRTVANITLQQRESLYSLIKEYSKMIDDIDQRNTMLREASRIVKGKQ